MLTLWHSLLAAPILGDPNVQPNIASSDRHWFIVSRWQEFSGEARANMLRVLAIIVFYAIQLIQRPGTAHGTSLEFHRQVTFIAVAWSLIALAVLLCLQRRIFPAILKYVVTTFDVALLTILAMLAGGPSSPVTNVYYLILALAALRASVGMTWYTTIACLLGYLTLVAEADPVWFDAEHATPIVNQLMMLACLAITGIVIGQVVRQQRSLAVAYAERQAVGVAK
ncbi:hypothetical protein ETAA8_57240 [Anatilimnocola aggregata]|uniref:Uncharacterized protein n=1 Tax=Anatilimnocola aggregata TaxID=2528021 RepID=A0A517YK22_9BACT|nr:hypothetical protein [Anatilimnocola aggregata]QDU30578.1 hypothetical protein ETAA8_57240 [Anatilimnocola aggregata]